MLTNSLRQAASDLKARQRENQFAAGGEKPIFSFDDRIVEVPWQDEESTWIHGAGFFFGSDRDQAAWRERPEFIGIYIGDAGEIFGGNAAEL